VKPHIHDPVGSLLGLIGKPENLDWYEGADPGTQNYQLTNGLHAYLFFPKHFYIPVVIDEIPRSIEVRTPEGLAMGIPASSLTNTGLARKLAGVNLRPDVVPNGYARGKWTTSQREELEEITSYALVAVENAWLMNGTQHMSIQTLSYRFDLSNVLSAIGIWPEAKDAGGDAPPTIALNDKGYEASGEAVSGLLNHGEQVLALDLIFNGFTRPQTPDPTDLETQVPMAGDRLLCLVEAQLLGVTHWFRTNNSHRQIQIEIDRIRSALISVVAASIDQCIFSVGKSHHVFRSLRFLFNTRIAFRSAPDPFCLDLYKYIDIDSITAIAAPTIIKHVTSVQWLP